MTSHIPLARNPSNVSTSLSARVLGIAALALVATVAIPSAASAQRPDRPRLRFGLSAVGGGFAGALHGGAGGISPRLGLQITDEMAIYVQGQGVMGRFKGEPGDSLTGFAFHSMMLEVTLVDLVMLGVGPSLDFIWGCDDPDQHECVDAGPYFGGNARIAVALSEPGPQHREGVVISIDVHPTLFGGTAMCTFLLGAGFELY